MQSIEATPAPVTPGAEPSSPERPGSPASILPDRLARWGLLLFALAVVSSNITYYTLDILPPGFEELDRVVRTALEREPRHRTRRLENLYLLDWSVSAGEWFTDQSREEAAGVGLWFLWFLAIPAWFLFLRSASGNERVAALGTVLLLGSPEVLNLGRHFTEHCMPYLVGVPLVGNAVLLRWRWPLLAPLLGVGLYLLTVETKIMVPVIALGALVDGFVSIRGKRRRTDALSGGIQWATPAVGFWLAMSNTDTPSVLSNLGETPENLAAGHHPKKDLWETLNQTVLPPEREFYQYLFVVTLVLAARALLRADRRSRLFATLMAFVGPFLVLPLFFIQARNDYVSFFTAVGFYPLLGLLLHLVPRRGPKLLLTGSALLVTTLYLGAPLVPYPGYGSFEGGMGYEPPDKLLPERVRQDLPHRYRLHPVRGPMTIELLLDLPGIYVAEIPPSARELYELCPVEFPRGRRPLFSSFPGRDGNEAVLYLFHADERCYISQQPHPGSTRADPGGGLVQPEWVLTGATTITPGPAQQLLPLGPREGYDSLQTTKPSIVWMETRVDDQDQASHPSGPSNHEQEHPEGLHTD